MQTTSHVTLLGRRGLALVLGGILGVAACTGGPQPQPPADPKSRDSGHLEGDPDLDGGQEDAEDTP
jgi:hypothetical protein